VTASICADTSGGALSVLSVTSFVMETETETPDPGELPPGVKPVPFFRKQSHPLDAARAPAVLDMDVAAVNPSQLVEPLGKCSVPSLAF
jgi:hypothetical protein